MSKEGEKHKVFRTTRVRSALKSDGFWIQKLKQEDEEQDKARTEHVVETRPSPGRQNSYVLSTAKMFESVDCPLSPPHHMTQFAPSEGDSANQANGEVIPSLRDVQPEGSTVETTDDAEPQAPTEELIQNGEAQPEKSVADNVEHNDGAAEISAEVRVAECIQDGEAQPESSTKENPEAAPAEQPVANATEENKGEHPDATVDQSNVEPTEASVSADAHVADPVAETSAAVAEVPAAPVVELTPQEELSTETEPANSTHLEDAGVESAVKPEEVSREECPPEQAAEVVEVVAEVVAKSSSDVVDTEETALQDSVEAVAEEAAALETPAVTGAAGEEAAATQVSVEPVPDLVVETVSEVPTQTATEAATEGSCETAPLEQAAEEIVEAVADVVVESSPETPAGAAGEEAALQISVEPVPDLVVETVSELPTETATETAPEGSCETAPLEAVVEPVADVVVESSPETPAGAAGEEAATQVSVESVPDLVVETVSELPTETATETAPEGICETAPLEAVVEAVADVVVESSPETPAGAAGEEDALQVSVESVPDLVVETVSELPTQTATETAPEGSCETAPLEQAAETVVEAVADVVVESSPETPAGAAGEEAALQISVEPVPDLVADTVPESPPQAAAEITVEPVESTIVSAVSAETVLETRAEEAVECEVQSVDNAAVEQSVEPTPERATDGVVKIEDAIEAVAASDAEAAQVSDRLIELSEALDVEPPITEAAPEPLEDPKQSHVEETKLNTEHSDTNISLMLQRYREELQSNLTPGITWKRTRNKNVCSFCDKTIDGNVKIHLSDPVLTCHPDCLKCGVCAKTLGDMMTPMFFHAQVVQCRGCFVRTLA